MKNLKKLILTLFVLIAIHAAKSQSLYRTYSQVHTELTNAGCSIGTAPSGFPASWSGGTLYFYHKSGTTGVVVYAYATESDIPNQAKNDCDLKAYVENNVEKCAGPGNECKVVSKTASNGQIYEVEMVCCG